MKRSILVALMSLFLGACACFDNDGTRAWVRAVPTNPHVVVINNVVVVDQEPLVIRQTGLITITWQLDPNGSYFFPTGRPGVEFVGERRLAARCGRDVNDKKKYSCTYEYNGDLNRGKFPYQLRVTLDDLPGHDLTSDPTVMND